MAKYMTVSAIGPKAVWADPSLDNEKIIKLVTDHWKQQIELVLPDNPDLIVLHEACDRPENFSMERRLDYYDARGEIIRGEMAKIARDAKCHIAYCAAKKTADGSYRNMTEIIDREGNSAGTYNKNHLVPVEYEKGGILYGKEPSVINLDCVRVAPIICFDLNFTELLDKIIGLKPEMLIFSSMYHGGIMQSYWAYQARAFFVGAISNQPCEILTPLGTVLARSSNYSPRVTARVNLDCAVVHLDDNIKRVRDAHKKYETGLKIEEPSFLGSMLLSCERHDMTVHDIIREFEILPLDDYLSACRAHRMTEGHIEL